MMAVADTPRQGSGHRQMHFRRLFHFLLAVVVLIVQLSLCFNSLAISHPNKNNGTVSPYAYVFVIGGG